MRLSWRHTETPIRGEEDDPQANSSPKHQPPHEQADVQPPLLVHVVWRRLLLRMLVCARAAVEGSGGSPSLVLSSPADAAPP